MKRLLAMLLLMPVLPLCAAECGPVLKVSTHGRIVGHATRKPAISAHAPARPMLVLPANRLPAQAIVPPGSVVQKKNANPEQSVVTMPPQPASIDRWRLYSYP